MTLPQLILVVIVWAVCSWLVLSVIADIKVRDRDLTRWRWARILYVIGGPVTIVVVVVVCLVIGFAQGLHENFSRTVPRKVQAFMNQPTSGS